MYLCSKEKGLAEVWNFSLTSYESARKPQLDNRDRLHDFKLLQNIACTEKVEICSPYNTPILTIIFPFRGVFFPTTVLLMVISVFSCLFLAFQYFLFIYCVFWQILLMHTQYPLLSLQVCRYSRPPLSFTPSTSLFLAMQSHQFACSDISCFVLSNQYCLVWRA